MDNNPFESLGFPSSRVPYSTHGDTDVINKSVPLYGMSMPMSNVNTSPCTVANPSVCDEASLRPTMPVLILSTPSNESYKPMPIAVITNMDDFINDENDGDEHSSPNNFAPSMEEQGNHHLQIYSHQFHQPQKQQLQLMQPLDQEDQLHSLTRPCIKVSEYAKYNWTLKENVVVRYQQIINFSRCSSPRNGQDASTTFSPSNSSCHNCVMCGLSNVHIPSQNKDVCRACDSSYWFCQPFKVVVKFCKGCKNFVTLSGFDDKPEASKCGRCRHRGRMNYVSKKATSSPDDCTPGESSLADFSPRSATSKNSADEASPKNVEIFDNEQSYAASKQHPSNKLKKSNSAAELSKDSSTALREPPALFSTLNQAKFTENCHRGPSANEEVALSNAQDSNHFAINLLTGMQRVNLISSQQKQLFVTNSAQNTNLITDGDSDSNDNNISNENRMNEHVNGDNVFNSNNNNNDNNNTPTPTIITTNNTTNNSINSITNDINNDDNGVDGISTTNKRKRPSIQNIYDNLDSSKKANTFNSIVGNHNSNTQAADSLINQNQNQNYLSISSPLLTSVLAGRRNSESALSRVPIQYRSPLVNREDFEGNTNEKTRFFHRSGSFDAAMTPAKTANSPLDPLMHLAMISESVLQREPQLIPVVSGGETSH